jgi:4-hydroxy-4-methyl-2-oxoglutarate aldolase
MGDIFTDLTTPLIADACVRLRISLRLAPSGIVPLARGMRIAGRVLPARHRGSVDVFIEAMKKSTPGDVLVIDNQGRTDEGCIGDLTVLEGKAWGLSGFVVRGLIRDTSELALIGFPVFSYGSLPAGPRRLDERGPLDLVSADWGSFTVDQSDTVFADDDGVIFVPSSKLEEILKVAKSIYNVERSQAERIKAGKRLWDQLDFDGYLTKRATDPSYSLRRHLKERGGAVEE